MVSIGEKVFEVVAADLHKRVVEAGYKKEQEYLEAQKKDLEGKRDALMDQVAELLGELVLYSSKIEEIEDRVFSLRIGEAQKMDEKNEETKKHCSLVREKMLEQLGARRTRRNLDGEKSEEQVDVKHCHSQG